MGLPQLAALCLLCAALGSRAMSAPVGADPPVSCCFTYATVQIPLKFVKDYYYTNSKCPQPAVVLITKKGREVCADPEADWTQAYINELEMN